MSNLLRKLAFSFLAFLVLFFSIAPNFMAAKAATPAPTWYNSSFGDWYGKVYDPKNSSEIFGERYTAAQVQWVMYGLFAFIINSTTNSNIVQCFLNNSLNIASCEADIKNLLTFDTNTSKLAESYTTVPQNTSLWGLVFADRPFSGISYVKEHLQNFSLVPVVHAQTVGFGFTALKPIQNMWSASRDIAFGLFVLAAIVFSFMIMFRVKISPQVVISVQSAIPKLIISLILVTFSYAIAGFMVDLMYVVIGLLSVVGERFLPIHGTAVVQGLFNFLTLGQPFNINIQIGVFGLLLVYMMLFPIAMFIVLFTQIGLIGTSLLGALAGLGLAALTPVIPVLIIFGVIVFVILMLIAGWSVIKVFWALLKTFANILLLVIFAPLQIVAGVVIPNFGFGQWLKSLASNLAVFVLTGFLILLSYIFMIQGVVAGTNMNLGLGERFARFIFGSGIVDPFTGSNAWPPLLGGGQSMVGILLLGVSFVIFTMIPKATELVQSLLSGKPFAYGSGIGEAFGPIRGAWNQYGVPVQRSMQEYSGSLSAGNVFGGLGTAARKVGLSNLEKRFQILQDAANRRILTEEKH
jgi:hypothetical protein